MSNPNLLFNQTKVNLTNFLDLSEPDEKILGNAAWLSPLLVQGFQV